MITLGFFPCEKPQLAKTKITTTSKAGSRRRPDKENQETKIRTHTPRRRPREAHSSQVKATQVKASQDIYNNITSCS